MSDPNSSYFIKTPTSQNGPSWPSSSSSFIPESLIRTAPSSLPHTAIIDFTTDIDELKKNWDWILNTDKPSMTTTLAPIYTPTFCYDEGSTLGPENNYGVSQ